MGLHKHQHLLVCPAKVDKAHQIGPMAYTGQHADIACHVVTGAHQVINLFHNATQLPRELHLALTPTGVRKANAMQGSLWSSSGRRSAISLVQCNRKGSRC